VSSTTADLIKDVSETNDICCCTDITNDISLLRCNILRKLDSVQDKLIQNDILRMQNSVKMAFYKYIRTHCKIDKRMVNNKNWMYNNNYVV
jgi:hypothetical protein